MNLNLGAIKNAKKVKMNGKPIISQPYDFRVVASGSGAMKILSKTDDFVSGSSRDVVIPMSDGSNEALGCEMGSSLSYKLTPPSSGTPGSESGEETAHGYDGIQLLPISPCHRDQAAQKYVWRRGCEGEARSEAAQATAGLVPVIRLPRAAQTFASFPATRYTDINSVKSREATGGNTGSQQVPIPSHEQHTLVSSPSRSPIYRKDPSAAAKDKSEEVILLPDSPSPMPRAFSCGMHLKQEVIARD